MLIGRVAGVVGLGGFHRFVSWMLDGLNGSTLSEEFGGLAGWLVWLGSAVCIDW